MNKTLVICAGFLLLLTAPLLQAEESAYPAPSDEVLTQFYKSLIDDVNKAQEDVASVVNEASDTQKVDLATWIPKLKNSILMLNMKYLLAWEFRGSPALRSPLIRDKLLSVMAKDEITDTDIEILQRLLARETEKIGTAEHASNKHQFK
jgi:hypothetical protein